MYRSCWVSRMVAACGHICRRRTTRQPPHPRHDASGTPEAGPAPSSDLPPPGPTAASGSRGRRAVRGRPRRRRSRGRVLTDSRPGVSNSSPGRPHPTPALTCAGPAPLQRGYTLGRPPSGGVARWAAGPSGGRCAEEHSRGRPTLQRAVRWAGCPSVGGCAETRAGALPSVGRCAESRSPQRGDPLTLARALLRTAGWRAGIPYIPRRPYPQSPRPGHPISLARARRYTGGSRAVTHSLQRGLSSGVVR